VAFYVLAERLGSGDGERETLLTRQIAFEPLPASVLFVLRFVFVVVHSEGGVFWSAEVGGTGGEAWSMADGGAGSGS